MNDLPGKIDGRFVQRSYELARSAAARGNHPFGALLAREQDVLLECENAVVTSKDVTRHAETGLVSLATPRFDRETLKKSTLYTSTEPCLMCCGAIHWAGILRVVFGVGAARMSQSLGDVYRGIPGRKLFARLNPQVVVLGPVLEDEGLLIHRDLWPREP